MIWQHRPKSGGKFKAAAVQHDADLTELADWLRREVPQEVDTETLKRFRLLVQTAEDAGIRSGLELHPDIAIAMGDFRQEHLPTLLQRMHVLWLDLAGCGRKVRRSDVVDGAPTGSAAFVMS